MKTTSSERVEGLREGEEERDGLATDGTIYIYIYILIYYIVKKKYNKKHMLCDLLYILYNK